MLNKTLLVLCLGLAAQIAFARSQEITSGDWQTKTTSGAGDIVLHWTHVFEGKDTVYKIDITPKSGPTTFLRVEGQPVFNSDKTLVAFPYCADDGCLSEVAIVDVMTRKKLPSVKVPAAGQIYVACTWQRNVLRVAVEFEFAGPNTSRKATHVFTISVQR